MQIFMARALVTYVSSGSSQLDEFTTIINLALLLIVMECIPAAKGWVGEDIESFTTNISYIFSEKISTILTNLKIPLFGATLALCLESKGLLGRTIAFTGVNTLSSLVFEAISGGELSLAWPVTLLYFFKELNSKYEVNSLFNFGLYRASDAIYSSLSVRKIPASTVFMTFIFLGSISPRDPVWTGVCALVFVQAGSDWLLEQLEIISLTDPFLAGLSLLTAVHFISITIENIQNNDKKGPNTSK